MGVHQRVSVFPSFAIVQNTLKRFNPQTIFAAIGSNRFFVSHRLPLSFYSLSEKIARSSQLSTPLSLPTCPKTYCSFKKNISSVDASKLFVGRYAFSHWNNVWPLRRQSLQTASLINFQHQGKRGITTAAENAENNCVEREEMEFDVVIVGGGISGLGCAIRLMQKAKEMEKELTVCVVEKGAEIGAHILSGNVFEPRALLELFPTCLSNNELFSEDPPPLVTPVQRDSFFLYTEKYAIPIPHILLPSQMNNKGNYVISLGSLCQWLARRAEELGVEIYPGFAAAELIIEENSGALLGIQTADAGIDKSGKKKGTYQPGIRLLARQTIFAEGCRGHLSERVIEKYSLRQNSCPQQYAIGLKEIWEIQPEKHYPGYVSHSVGWPLPQDVYGGSFVYHMENNLVLLGFAVGLDYKNPYLNPYNEFQRLKHHPNLYSLLENGRCISYGARCLVEGGFQALPKLTFPGGLLVGDAAGFLNVPKIKGSHTALKSGIVAGETVASKLLGEHASMKQSTFSIEITEYADNMKASWIWPELRMVRNVKRSFHYGGLFGGLMHSGLSLYLRGKEPWTLTWKEEDSETTEAAEKYSPISYPKPDGIISFDILDNLIRSGTNHEHDQPSHLKVKPHLQEVPVDISLKQFAAPETRFCPAKVYEFIPDETTGKSRLQINAQNCLHCKCCAIKTPRQYIDWTVPEGGGGPAYSGM